MQVGRCLLLLLASRRVLEVANARPGLAASLGFVAAGGLSSKKDSSADLPALGKDQTAVIEAIKKADKTQLAKIATIMKEAEDYQKRIDTMNLNFHPKVLNETEVYKIVKQVLPTPEDKLIQMIESKQVVELKFFQKAIQKNIKTIPNFQAIRIVETLRVNEVEVNEEVNNKIWSTFRSEFSRRIKNLSLSELAQLLYTYAYANRSNPDFFREIECELLERDLKYIPFHSIEKILEGFSYSNLGSATLYQKIARSIKLVQFEFAPIKLARFAYLFSKTSDSLKGGFGIYAIAEARVLERLPDYQFNELVKLSKYFISQNIGSNQFLLKLEEQLLEKYQAPTDPALLIKLCKYTSKHFWQTPEKKLYHKIESECIKYMDHFSPQQLSLVVWSYSRGRSGSSELYERLTAAFKKQAPTLKQRQLAFSYFSFAASKKGTADIFTRLEQAILKDGLQTYLPHYLIKILNGINIRDSYGSVLFQPIMQHLQKSFQQLKVSDLVSTLKTIVEIPQFFYNQADHSQQNELYGQYFSFFVQSAEKLSKIASTLRHHELCTLYYCYIEANAPVPLSFLQESLLANIKTPNDTPKPIFCRYLYSLVQSFEVERSF